MEATASQPIGRLTISSLLHGGAVRVPTVCDSESVLPDSDMFKKGDTFKRGEKLAGWSNSPNKDCSTGLGMQSVRVI